MAMRTLGNTTYLYLYLARFSYPIIFVKQDHGTRHGNTFKKVLRNRALSMMAKARHYGTTRQLLGVRLFHRPVDFAAGFPLFDGLSAVVGFLPAR